MNNIAGECAYIGKYGAAGSQRVTVTIADDGSGLPWEGGVNGRFYRITRGKPVSVPREVAELIKSSEPSNMDYINDYTTPSGKCLTR